MAVEEPAARIVRFERDHDGAVGGQQDDVAARGVVELQGGEGAVERGRSLCEEDEIVTVYVELPASY